MWSRVYHPRSWSDPSWIRSPGRPSAQGTESMPCHVCDPGAHPGLVQSRNRWRRRVGRAANSGPCPFLQGQGGRHGQGPEVPSGHPPSHPPSHPLPQSPSCQRWVDLQRNKRELSPGRTPGPEAGARILPVSASPYLTPPTLLDSGRGFRGRVQPGPALLALWGLASRCPGWGQGVPGGRGTLASTALWFRHLLAVPWGPSLGYPISRDEP